jgi:hypothetical protein
VEQGSQCVHDGMGEGKISQARLVRRPDSNRGRLSPSSAKGRGLMCVMDLSWRLEIDHDHDGLSIDRVHRRNELSSDQISGLPSKRSRSR